MTFSGVAYRSSRIFSGKVQQILHWPGTNDTFRKIPTCILYDDHGKVKAWGLEAKNASLSPDMWKCEWLANSSSTWTRLICEWRNTSLGYSGSSSTWNPRYYVAGPSQTQGFQHSPYVYLYNHLFLPDKSFLHVDGIELQPKYGLDRIFVIIWRLFCVYCIQLFNIWCCVVTISQTLDPPMSAWQAACWPNHRLP